MSTNCLACQDGKRLSPGWKCDVCGRLAHSSLHPVVRHPSHVNNQYQKAVTDACAELAEMTAPTATWETHAAVVITKHLTPLFRAMRDDVKRMDWLDAHGPAIHLKGPMQGVASANPGYLRECIDEAMREDA